MLLAKCVSKGKHTRAGTSTQTSRQVKAGGMVVTADAAVHSAPCMHSSPVRCQHAKLSRPVSRANHLLHTSTRNVSRTGSPRHTCAASKTGAAEMLCLVQRSTVCFASTAGRSHRTPQLWTPERELELPHVQAAAAPAVVSPGSGYEDHKPRTPPPDLPSLLLDSRITYLGMPVGLYYLQYVHHA